MLMMNDTFKLNVNTGLDGIRDPGATVCASSVHNRTGSLYACRMADLG